MLNQNHANRLMMDESFEPYIKRVLEAHAFGVSRGNIELNYITSSGKTKADRFNLLVPYAGQKLEWTVMFNSNCPDLGPDFEFNNDSFLSDPDIDTIDNHIPSLANWQPMDPSCLLNVLTELTRLYKEYQLEILNDKVNILYEEYLTIIKESDVKPEDVEVILSPSDSSPNEVKFYIRMNIDFSRLPGRSNKATEDQAMLVLSCRPPTWCRIIPQLYLSFPLEATFGGTGNLDLPAFQPNKRMKEYLNDIKKIIDGKIDEVANNFEMRNQFIASLLLMRRRNIIEYDSINFRRITILLEHQDFYFLVHFHLSPGFPKTQPTVNLQSIYHMNQKDDLMEIAVKNIPYSPSWSAPIMITKIINKIIDKDLATLKKSSFGLQNCR